MSRQAYSSLGQRSCAAVAKDMLESRAMSIMKEYILLSAYQLTRVCWLDVVVKAVTV